MWNIRRQVKKGDYMYAVVPEHPKATKNHYVLMHRVVVENHIGRLLNDDEIVHHIDHNKMNNNIENLEILNSREHCKLHGKEHGHNNVRMKCPCCGKEFTRARNQTFLVKPQKYQFTCCSKTCSATFHRYIQLYGITEEMQRAINENVISIYKEYLLS